MRHRFGPLTGCLIAAALFGASPPVAKAMLDQIGPITLAGLLYLGAAIGVLPFARRGGSPERRRHPAHRRNLAGAIVFGGIAGPVLLLLGLARAPAASVSLWLNLETVATVAIAWLLFREHMDRRTWLGAASVLGAGVMLAAPFDPPTLASAGLVAAACVCWGLDNNFTALIDGYTPAQSTLIKGAVAGAVNLALGIAFEGPPAPAVIAGALAIGALAYGISIMLYIASAHQLGATRSQLVFATAPAWGLATAWLWLGESPSWIQVSAIAPIACGIALLVRVTHDHEHAHDAITHTHAHRHDDDHHGHLHPGLPAWVRHTHEHSHEPVSHRHPHQPDLHHRHRHT